jgi:tRNA modification GTPase
VLIVLDGSLHLTPEDRRVIEEVRGKTAITIVNKSDLPRKLEMVEWPAVRVSLSCRTGEGLDDLRRALSDLVTTGTGVSRTHFWAVNQRHKTALEQAKGSLEKALSTVRDGLSPEFIALDLRDALDSLGLIIGAMYTEDILERIFNDFCIGK